MINSTELSDHLPNLTHNFRTVSLTPSPLSLANSVQYVFNSMLLYD